MRRELLALIAIAIAGIAVAPALAAEQTWTGRISDSLCSAYHKTMAEQVTPPLSDIDCTKACIDSNARYVFVDETNKTLRITNQQFAGLKEQAGHTVKLTGELKNNAITVTKIEMAKATK